MTARRLLVLVLGASAVLPLALLVVASLAATWHYPALLPGAWTTAAWRPAFAAGGRLGPALVTSALLAGGAAALAVAVGLPAGDALARLRGWPRHAGAALAFLPVAAPPIALATGLHYTLLRLGLGGTPGGVLLAHAVPAAGYATLFFTGTFAVLDRRVVLEARSLGATARQAWWRVELPLLRRPIVDAFVLAFLVSWAQVPLTLLIGGGAVRSLPLEVVAYVLAGQDRDAAAGALLLTLPPMLLLLAAGRLTRALEVPPP